MSTRLSIHVLSAVLAALVTLAIVCGLQALARPPVADALLALGSAAGLPG